MAALDELNASGDAAPGFRWRLQTEDGDATAVQAFDGDAADSYGVIVNLTVWSSIEALADWAFADPHVRIMGRRREWFARAAEATTALWWVPAGHRPSTDEAEDRVLHLRRSGPTPRAFTFQRPFPSPAEPSTAVEPSSDWLCPA